MNAFVNSLYHSNYTGIINPERNDEGDTDDEDLVRTSSNSNECDDAIVLDSMCCCYSHFISRKKIEKVFGSRVNV